MNTTTHRRWHESVYIIQGISVIQYLLKGLTKIGVGMAIASPMIMGDGYHNLGDIAQALLIMGGVALRNHAVKGYPYKLKEVETALTALVGFFLSYTAIKIGGSSVIGLVAQAPSLDHTLRAHLPLPAYQPVLVDRKLLWPLIGLMGGSVLVSLIMSWLQIRAGKLNGEAAVVADAKETRADAGVELMTLIGVILVQAFGWRWAEHVLGVVVALFVLHTAYEIGRPSIDTFLKRSLGEAVEKQLIDAVMHVYGVESTNEPVTFRIGRGLAVCNLTVVTRHEAARHRGLRFALEQALTKVLLEVEDIREVDLHLVLEEPPSETHRVAYACVQRDHSSYRIVRNVGEATHLLICDIIRHDPAKSRCRPHPITGDVHDFVEAKRVTTLLVYGSSVTHGWRTTHEYAEVLVERTHSNNPEVELGVPFEP